MFIQTAYTGKGKTVAFFPWTMAAGDETVYRGNPSLKNRPPKLNFLYVSAYWHEIKNGKHIVCYGIVEGRLSDDEFPDGINNPNFSFDNFLEAAYTRETEQAKNNHGFWVGFTGLHKLGHSKPWDIVYEPAPKFNPEEAYDPQVLADMITNPARVPAGAVGWFKMVANRS